MADLPRLKGRYELKEVLERGGMGVVYRAYDTVLKCDVAVKTIRDAPDPTQLQLFHRECEVLVALNHPNIVPILDIGQFDEEGKSKPYFVMPLLPGMPLSRLIRSSASQLTIQRCVEILSQVCRGLHAAHECGLVHRDLKPGNIFVMPDFSVEIIDFGVAHMVSAGMTGQKGTLLYMAPELLEGKSPTVLSDIFALGVTAYELFTRRRPFERPTEQEVVEAIRNEIPPPASDLDPAVSGAISRVIHKAMAKQPWHRFSTAREFAECLEKARRGEPIEYFDPARIQPRVQRARRALEQADHQFAWEIVTELEAEGHLDPELALLRRQISVAIRQKRIQQLLDSARSRLEEEEYPLALQKIQELLELEPDNAEALGLKSKVESTRSERQIEGWFRLARQHIENNAFGHAREALQKVFQLRPEDSRANALLAEVSEREQEYLRIRQEKEALYHAAVEAYQKGDISEALTKLERVLEMDGRAPDTSQPERGAAYQNFYNQVRSEYEAVKNSYAQARKHLENQAFAEALSICEGYLKKYPGHALFQALKFEIEERQRLQLSSYIAGIDRRLEAEPDLERKVSILEEALERYPDERHFQRLLRLERDRRDLVNAIVAKARNCEERGQFGEALGQWEILRSIHGKYPGIQFEIERLIKRKEQQARLEAKGRSVEQIDRHLEDGDYERALAVARQALEVFPGEGELVELQKLAQQGHERRAQAARLLGEGEAMIAEGRFEEGIDKLRKARQLDERSTVVQTVLVEKLAERARSLMETNWRDAEKLVGQVLQLDPNHAAARSMSILLKDARREEFLDQSVSRIRQSQAGGDLVGALSQVEEALSFYPDEPRLIQLHATLKKSFLETERAQSRRRDLEQLEGLARGLDFVPDTADRQSVLELMAAIAAAHPGDPDFQSVVKEAEQHLAILKVQGMAAPAAAAAGQAEAAPPEIQPQPMAKAPLSAAGIPGATAILGGLDAGAPQPSPGPPAAPTAATGEHAGRAPRAWRGLLRRPVILAGAGLVLVACVGAWIMLRSRGTSEAVTPFQVGTAPPAPADLPRKHYPPRVRINTDLKASKVQLDGVAVGELPPSGELSLDSLTPGKHTLKIESGRSSATLTLEARPAGLAVLGKPEVSTDLDAVVVSTLPPRAQVRSTLGAVRARLDGQDVGELGPDGLELAAVAAGTHSLSLGEGETWWTRNVEVGSEPQVMAFLISRRPVAVELETARAAAPTPPSVTRAPPKPAPRTMDSADWDKPWQQQGDWFTRRGGGFVLYRVIPPVGSFHFTVRPQDTWNPFDDPKIRWVLDYRDDRNYVLFELDKRSYSCAEYRNGKRSVRLAGKSHGVRTPYYILQLIVEPKRVVVRTTTDNKDYRVLDDWTRDNGDFAVGRFGFLLPGNDQIWLANFTFSG